MADLADLNHNRVIVELNNLTHEYTRIRARGEDLARHLLIILRSLDEYDWIQARCDLAANSFPSLAAEFRANPLSALLDQDIIRYLKSETHISFVRWTIIDVTPGREIDIP